MADQKLTELTEATAATTDDLLYVVNDPGGTPVGKKITFDNLQKSITEVASLKSNGAAQVPVDSFIYIGDPSTDGSWRFTISAGDLSFQKRVSGSWVEKGGVS